MAVKDLIPLISPYTVGTGGTISDTDFTNLSGIAVARLGAMYPGIDTSMPVTLYEYVQALMICHLQKASQGNTEKSSETFGDTAWSKNPGTTAYLLELTQTVQDWETGEIIPTIINAGTERADIDMPVKLDKGVKRPYSGFYDTDQVNTGRTRL
jgi:hypothetical protein